MDALRITSKGTRATLVIDRAERRNALTQEMWEVLPDLVQEALTFPGVRVLVLTSAVSGVFSAGADVVEYRQNAGNVEWGLKSQDRVARALKALRDAPVPTIAAVDGPCIGGGFGLAMACDFRLVTDRATFGVPSAKLGMIFPFGDIVELISLIGPAATRRVLFTGQTLDAQWAFWSGFADEIQTPELLMDAVDRWTGALHLASPQAVRATKRMIRSVTDGRRLPTSETDQFVTQALQSSDHLEGVAAFLERRSPSFKT